MSRMSNCRAVSPNTTLSGIRMCVGTLWDARMSCLAFSFSCNTMILNAKCGRSLLAGRCRIDQACNCPGQESQGQTGERSVQRCLGVIEPALVLARGHVQDRCPDEEERAGSQSEGHHVGLQIREELRDAPEHQGHLAEWIDHEQSHNTLSFLLLRETIPF